MNDRHKVQKQKIITKVTILNIIKEWKERKLWRRNCDGIPKWRLPLSVCLVWSFLGSEKESKTLQEIWFFFISYFVCIFYMHGRSLMATTPITRHVCQARVHTNVRLSLCVLLLCVLPHVVLQASEFYICLFLPQTEFYMCEWFLFFWRVQLPLRSFLLKWFHSLLFKHSCDAVEVDGKVFRFWRWTMKCSALARKPCHHTEGVNTCIFALILSLSLTSTRESNYCNEFKGLRDLLQCT